MLSLSLSLGLYSPSAGPWSLSFNFSILHTFGRTPWTGDQPVTRVLPTHITIQTQNKCTLTSLPRVGFESTIPEFGRARTVHPLDRATTEIGCYRSYSCSVCSPLSSWLTSPSVCTGYSLCLGVYVASALWTVVKSSCTSAIHEDHEKS
jgi:hypothetical protein